MFRRWLNYKSVTLVGYFYNKSSPGTFWLHLVYIILYEQLKLLVVSLQVNSSAYTTQQHFVNNAAISRHAIITWCFWCCQWCKIYVLICNVLLRLIICKHSNLCFLFFLFKHFITVSKKRKKVVSMNKNLKALKSLDCDESLKDSWGGISQSRAVINIQLQSMSC